MVDSNECRCLEAVVMSHYLVEGLGGNSRELALWNALSSNIRRVLMPQYAE